MIPVEFEYSVMGTAAECTNCHVQPSIELNLTKAEFIRGASQQPVSRMFVYIIRRLDRSPFCFIQFNPVFIASISKEALFRIPIP